MSVKLRDIAIVGLLCAISACSQGASPTVAGNSDSPATIPSSTNKADANAWLVNGATACDKYLTQSVMYAVLRIPFPQAQRLGPSSCHSGPISITLKIADMNEFRRKLSTTPDAHAVSDIGDGAYWTEAGTLFVVQGNRGCEIIIDAPPGDVRAGGEAGGRILAPVCIELFDLP